MKIQSPLKLTECLERLEKTTVKNTFLSSISANAGSIMCKLNQTKFRLWQMKRRNSWAPFFYGEFFETIEGTEINGEFKIHPFVRIFMIFWFGVLVLVSGLSFIAGLMAIGVGFWDLWTGIFVTLIFSIMPWGLITFGIGLFRLGQWLGKSQEIYITQYLQTAFASKEFSIKS